MAIASTTSPNQFRNILIDSNKLSDRSSRFGVEKKVVLQNEETNKLIFLPKKSGIQIAESIS